MPRKISVEIVGDSRSLERAFDRSARSARNFNRDIGKVGRTRSVFSGLRGSVLGLAGSFIGGYGLASAVETAFSEMADAQKTAAQTRAVLKSTGRAAGVSAKHIEGLAKKLMNLSGVDDEVIQGGENILLTFKDIRNSRTEKIFDKATKATLDLSTALGQDMRTSAIQVGKALNDPIKGVGSLRRVGVQFTKAQEDMIKKLVESGDKVGAQKIILHELNTEFGHSAEMAGKTLPGRFNILKENLKNLAGTIAQKFAPDINKFINHLNKWLQNPENQKKVLDTLKQIFGTIRDIFKGAWWALQQINKITGSTKHSLEILLGALLLYKSLKIAGAIANIAENIGLIGTRAKTSTGQVRNLSGVLKRMLPFAVGAAAAVGGMRQQTQKIRIQTPGGKVITGTGTDIKGNRTTISGIPYVKGTDGVWRPAGAGRSRMIAPTAAVAGAGAVGGAVYTGPINVYGVQNPRAFENELAKRHRARPHTRRGAR